MNRFNPSLRKWVYRFIAERDGEICLLCGKRPHKGRHLQIDHIDQNPNNNEPQNLCLLCAQCNKKLEGLTPKQHQKLIEARSIMCECVRERDRGNGNTGKAKAIIGYSESKNKEIRANDYFEVRFREWLLKEVQRNEFYPRDEAINSGAEMSGCSTTTAQRYLAKLCSFEGVLEVFSNNGSGKLLRYKTSKLPEVKIEDIIAKMQELKPKIDNLVKAGLERRLIPQPKSKGKSLE